MEKEFDWMNEHVKRLPKHNTFYKFACFITGRMKTGMTYKEIFLIVSRLNERKDDEHFGKRYAMNVVLRAYQFLNNKLPKGFEGYAI